MHCKRQDKTGTLGMRFRLVITDKSRFLCWGLAWDRRAGLKGFSLLFCATATASIIAQTVAFPVGFEDMHAMGETVQQSAGEPFGTEHFDPVLKGQIGGVFGGQIRAKRRCKEMIGSAI